MPPVVPIFSVAQTFGLCVLRYASSNHRLKSVPPGNWLGRKDSNLRMPDPKTGALPLGDAPTLSAHISGRKLCEDFACRAHRASIETAPNRSTRKDAPTSLEFDRLNGAFLRIPAVKNPKHCRPAARQQGLFRTGLHESDLRPLDLRFKFKHHLLEIVLKDFRVETIRN